MRLLFPSQQADETIHLVVREHWAFLLFRLLVVIFLFALLLAFQAYIPTLAPGLFEGTAGRVTLLASQIYTLGLVLTVFLIWVFYYLNVQIITNLRIVDIDQKGLFSRSIAELHIDKIEDVTSESNGALATVFQYGNVYVQTAGTVERFEFDHVPAPERIEKIILDLYERRPKLALPPR
jgi:hypothetical protein